MLQFLMGAIREQRIREREKVKTQKPCSQPECSSAVHPAYAAAGDKCEDCWADSQQIRTGRDRSATIR